MKMRPVTNGDGSPYGVTWECPGCAESHTVPTHVPNAWGKAWGFNGDMHCPTLTPSILVHPHGALDDAGNVYQTPLCHSFIRAGRIEFLSDCTHALAGQTVDLDDAKE